MMVSGSSFWLCFVCCWVVCGGLAGPCWATQKEVSIAAYDLTGSLTEGGQVEANFMAFNRKNERPLTHFDLMRALKQLSEDDAIEGVVFDIDQADLNLSTLVELHRSLSAIRKAGKDVWLYSDQLNLATALVGSAANHFALNPEATTSLNGLYVEQLYLKGLLDKVGITADVVHIGDFKSAGEIFARTGPSDEAAEQLEDLFTALYGDLVRLVASGRGIPEESVKELINRGLFTPQEAHRAKLVDHLVHRTDIIRQIREHYGEELDIQPNYGLPETKGPEIRGMMDFLKLLFSGDRKKDHTADYLATVVLDDMITFETIEPVRREIIRLKDDPLCRGIVFRVNSPGGSALASEILWEATEEFRQTGRQLVVSMGDVAASGGYYVSTAADHIFAEPTTITGSIGVIAMKFSLGQTMEKLGITTHETKRGEHADLFNSTRPFTQAEREIVRDSMRNTYRTFTGRVARGRADRLTKPLDQITGGRVFTGAQALENGLVDSLGGLQEAIEHLAQELKLDAPTVHLYPEPKNPLEGLFMPEEDKETDEFITLRSEHTPLPSPALMFSQSLNPLKLRALLSPHKMTQLKHAHALMSAANQGQIYLLSPIMATPTLR